METAKSPKHLLSGLSMHDCPSSASWCLWLPTAPGPKSLNTWIGGDCRIPSGFWAPLRRNRHTDVGSADVDDLDFPIGAAASRTARAPTTSLRIAISFREDKLESRVSARAEIGFGSTEDRRAEAIRPHQRL